MAQNNLNIGGQAASSNSSANPRSTWTLYNRPNAIFAREHKDALGRSTVTDYDPRLGVPVLVTDPNQAQTAFVYDGLGRITAIYRPGDPLRSGQPSISYAYTAPYNSPNNGQVGIQIVESDRISAADGVRKDYKYYSGQGRLLEDRSEGLAGQYIITKYGYDPRGLVLSTTLPVTATGGLDYWGVDWTTNPPLVATRYNSLGQPVRAIAPNGTSSSAVAIGRTGIAEDPNGHVKFSFQDAFSRNTIVDETLVNWSDKFDTLSGSNYTIAGQVSGAGGVAVLTGVAGTSYIQRSPGGNLADLQGTVFSFKLDTDPATASGGLYLRSGTYGNSTYRKWGLGIDNGMLYRDAQSGTGAVDRVALMPVRSGVWYRVMLKLGAGNYGVYSDVSVWERDNTATNAERRDSKNLIDWGSQTWTYMAEILTGTLEVDNLDEVTFYRTSYAYNIYNQLSGVTEFERGDRRVGDPAEPGVPV